jgi:hypothetical protein
MSTLPALPKLSARQKRAIGLVLSASTLTEGLKAAGIGKTTWFNWKAQEPFLRACRVWEDACWAESLERAKGGALTAIDVLRELLTHKDPHVRLQACQTLLGYSLKVSERLDVMREIRELQKAVGLKK